MAIKRAKEKINAMEEPPEIEEEAVMPQDKPEQTGLMARRQ